MFAAVEDAPGLGHLHEEADGSDRFIPVEQGALIRRPALAVEDVIELRVLVHFAVVDVDGGEEKLRRFRTRKRERHRMDFRIARLELEDGESVVAVGGEFVPGASYQLPVALIEYYCVLYLILPFFR